MNRCRGPAGPAGPVDDDVGRGQPVVTGRVVGVEGRPDGV